MYVLSCLVVVSVPVHVARPSRFAVCSGRFAWDAAEFSCLTDAGHFACRICFVHH